MYHCSFCVNQFCSSHSFLLFFDYPALSMFLFFCSLFIVCWYLCSITRLIRYSTSCSFNSFPTHLTHFLRIWLISYSLTHLVRYSTSCSFNSFPTHLTHFLRIWLISYSLTHLVRYSTSCSFNSFPTHLLISNSSLTHLLISYTLLHTRMLKIWLRMRMGGKRKRRCVTKCVDA